MRAPRRPRQVVPRGFVALDRGGWLLPKRLPSEDVATVDAYETRAAAAAVMLLAMRAGDLPRGDRAQIAAYYREQSKRAVPFWFDDPNFDVREVWCGPLRFHLRVEACTPPLHRRDAATLVAHALAVLPADMPRPEGLVAAVRKVLGERHERLTPGGRGGGPTRKRAPAQAVEIIRRALRSQSARAAFVSRILHSVEANPGSSAREIRSFNGGSMARVRQALAALERAGKIENHGSERKPAYFVRSGD